jgi:phage gp29-like protein
MPVPVGKYPNNATPGEKSTLRAALRAFQQEASIMVPQGMEIELLEAAKSGIDTYERLCQYMDDQSAGVVLGKSGGKGSGGQLAANLKLENEVRLELVKADADLLSDTLQRQLVRWIVDYNMPGAPYPNVARVIEEPADLEKLAGTKEKLFRMGFRPTLESIKQDFGGDYTEVQAAAKGGALVANNDIATPAFAAPETPADQAIIDALLGSLADGPLQALMSSMLAPVVKAIRESANHQAALEKLVELFPDVSLDDLQQSLARALFIADTVGRLAVHDEAEG